MSTRVRPRLAGFTMIDLLAILLVMALFAGVVLVSSTGRRAGCGRPMNDSTQVRGIHQGMVLWAQSNNDRYPLPSLADAGNHTVALDAGQDATVKDATANIISMMIFQGFFSPELCISPAEVNANIKTYEKYEYESPQAAAGADKKLALWDPAFTSDFTSPQRAGAFSYAHTLPAEERKANRWSCTFSPNEPILGNRGPEIAGVLRSRSRSVTAIRALPESNTSLIHGPRRTWEGNMAYNDNHVNFESSVMAAPGSVTYTAHNGNVWNDVLFYDEPDDAEGVNAFLGNFITAGASKHAFTPIWD